MAAGRSTTEGMSIVRPVVFVLGVIFGVLFGTIASDASAGRYGFDRSPETVPFFKVAAVDFFALALVAPTCWLLADRRGDGRLIGYAAAWAFSLALLPVLSL